MCEADPPATLAQVIALFAVLVLVYRTVIASLHPRVPFWQLWKWWPNDD